MSSKVCIDQAAWDLLDQKFNQCVEKYNSHNQNCPYHNSPREENESRICVNRKEYTNIESFDDYWGELYKAHVEDCSYHKRFLYFKGWQFLQISFAEDITESHLIN